MTYTFTASQTQFTVSCVINDDAVSENLELFTLVLSTSATDVMIIPDSSQVEIVDDDSKLACFRACTQMCHLS